jgi:hypothetical protein
MFELTEDEIYILTSQFVIFIFATISHGAVDGINGQTFFPLVVFGIIAVSYIYYHKLNSNKI